MKRSRIFTLKGYVKYLDQVSFIDNADDLLTNNLLHNRLNFRYEPSKHFNVRIEVRNRLYYGEMVKYTPNFSSMLDNSNEWVNLSKTWIEQKALVLHSTIDRACAEYTAGKWDITLGGQRINWGINTVWTPNDIFNTFNYFDFDYEERPGSDAARVKYLISDFSSLEIAYAPGSNEHGRTGALLYRFNKWKYDFQVFSGIYGDDYTVGGGWAGNIKDAGFKGEATYFYPRQNSSDTNGTVSLTASLDYAFKDGIYLNGSFLYNSSGKDSLPNPSSFSSLQLSAKNLMPFRWSYFLQVLYPFTPILTGSLAVMYSPASNCFITLPTITYSVADNWELSLVGQSFFADVAKTYRTLGNVIFMRLKWGF